MENLLKERIKELEALLRLPNHGATFEDSIILREDLLNTIQVNKDLLANLNNKHNRVLQVING